MRSMKLVLSCIQYPPTKRHTHTTCTVLCYNKHITTADLWLVVPSSWWPRLPCWGCPASSAACLSSDVSCTSSPAPSMLHWCPGSVSYKHMPHTTIARRPAHWHACRSHCLTVSVTVSVFCTRQVLQQLWSKAPLPPPDMTAEIQRGCRTGKHVKWPVS